MVKVLAFAITEGRVAIHCHAGLGRTGVLIACYLVYSLRVSANDAIRYVRLRRPGSVQTRGQILCVRHFAQFILPQTITYYLKENINKDRFMNEFTLSKFLRRQKVALHGYDERNFKFLPKIVHCICERILKMCGCWIDEFPPSNIPFTADFLCTKLLGNIQRYESTYSLCSNNSDSLISSSELRSPSEEVSSPSSPNPSENGDPSDSFSELSTLDGDEMSEELLIENRCFQVLETQKNFNQELSEESINIQDIETVVDALLTDYSSLDTETKKKIKLYQHEINTWQLGWAKLAVEKDLKILSVLLFEWLESLKIPVIKREYFEHVVVLYKQAEVCFQKFALEDACLVEYLMRFLSKIQPKSKENQDDLLKRIIAACSKQTLVINDKIIPSDKGFRKFREGTLTCTIEFFQSLLELVENHHSLKTTMYLDDTKYNEFDNENDFQ